MNSSHLDLDDIQGDILRAYGNSYPRTSYIFVGVALRGGRSWLSRLVDEVTTATPWMSGKPEATLNIALTASGLAALGLSSAAIATFAPEFRDGMAARAGIIGDVSASAPEHWDDGLGTGASHVLATINAQTPEQMEERLSALRAGVDEAIGVTIVKEQHARLLDGAREHFGFADGMAQPAIQGATDEKARGGGVPSNDGWRALAPGEFIHGYPDEDTLVDDQRRLPPSPADPFGKNGTYMVWRKLHQNVALFRRTIREAAQRHYCGDDRRLAAKVVGRWQNGTPMETHPDAADPIFDPAAPGANDFRYSSDLDGKRCPIGAHVRRSNPRDGLGFEGKRTVRQRMIRRGMPYGDSLPDGVDEDDGAERGLIFVSFVASILRQFEGVQIPWLNDGNIFGLGVDRDYLLGDPSGAGTGKMTIQGDPPFFLAPQLPLVRMQGGEYLFVPGITALRAIAGE